MGNTFSIYVSNIDCDRRSSGILGKVFGINPTDDIEKMTKTVLKCLEEGKSCALCEVSKDAAEKLDVYIQSKYYRIIHSYNNDAYSFRYVIFLPEGVKPELTKHIPFTTSGEFYTDERPASDKEKRGNPDYIAETLGELFEKSGVYLKIIVDGKPAHLVLTHLGLTNHSKLSQAQCLIKWVNENIPKNEAMFICGDFNAFDMGGDGPFMPLYETFLGIGLKNAVPFDVHTFTPKPYDIVAFLNNKEYRDEYFKLLDRLKELDGKDDAYEEFEDCAKNFRELCYDKSKQRVPAGVALDNMLSNNAKVIVELIDTNSDHKALLCNITL